MATLDRDDAYYARTRLILKFRRVVNLACVFLAAYAVLTMLRSPEPMPRASVVLVESLSAFVLAALVAVNVFTLRARK